MQGSLNKEHFRGAGCLLGHDGPPPRLRTPPVSGHRDLRLGNATCQSGSPQARDLLHLSTGRRKDLHPAGAFAKQLEVRRSTARRFRVNSFRGPTLSLELCSKFLIELAPPVNIAYRRQIMSRDCDIPVMNRLLFLKEPRVVDATG
jgi:hypothetical protein